MSTPLKALIQERIKAKIDRNDVKVYKDAQPKLLSHVSDISCDFQFTSYKYQIPEYSPSHEDKLKFLEVYKNVEGLPASCYSMDLLKQDKMQQMKENRKRLRDEISRKQIIVIKEDINLKQKKSDTIDLTNVKKSNIVKPVSHISIHPTPVEVQIVTTKSPTLENRRKLNSKVLSPNSKAEVKNFIAKRQKRGGPNTPRTNAAIRWLESFPEICINSLSQGNEINHQERE